MKTKRADAWASPLAGRYASEEMSRLFSEQRKFETWRLLWLWLAEEERRLGLPIADEAISQMREHLTDIDFEAAAREEEQSRHDVMAHVRVFGKAAPAALRIIHWGATSAYVSDNADLIAVREGLGLVERRLVTTLRALRALALEHGSLRSLAYTHYQPTQPTTVGKRMALSAYDLLMDLEEVRRRRDNLRFQGAEGGARPGAGAARCVREAPDCLVTDLLAQAGRLRLAGAVGPRPVGAQDRDGPAPPPARRRDRGAFRGVPGRFLGDALQGKPD